MSDREKDHSQDQGIHDAGLTHTGFQMVHRHRSRYFLHICGEPDLKYCMKTINSIHNDSLAAAAPAQTHILGQEACRLSSLVQASRDSMVMRQYSAQGKKPAQYRHKETKREQNPCE